MKYRLLPLFMLLALLFTGCTASPKNETETDGATAASIIHITENNFDAEVLASDKPVLLDFYADWCGPCKMMAPILEEIAGERSDIKIGKVNVDEELALARSFAIEAMPTLIVIKDGEVVQRAVGYRDKAAILEML